MVDVETTGTNPQFSGIIQLAAIKFNFDTEDVGGTFDRCPQLLYGRFWDDNTKHFWQSHPDVLASIQARQEPGVPVYRDFVNWVCEDAPSRGYRFWAKPSKFDWPLVESHLLQCDLDMPFPHWQSRDLNSWIAGANHRSVSPPDMKWMVGQHTGPLHNALSDCVLQLRMLFNAKKGMFHEILPPTE